MTEEMAIKDGRVWKKLLVYECKKCGHIWLPRKKDEKPKCCPKCHVVSYNEAKRLRA